MKIHYGVIVAWLGSVGIYELTNRFIKSYALSTVLTVIALFVALWLEDNYGNEAKTK